MGFCCYPSTVIMIPPPPHTNERGQSLARAPPLRQPASFDAPNPPQTESCPFTIFPSDATTLPHPDRLRSLVFHECCVSKYYGSELLLYILQHVRLREIDRGTLIFFVRWMNLEKIEKGDFILARETPRRQTKSPQADKAFFSSVTCTCTYILLVGLAGGGAKSGETNSTT